MERLKAGLGFALLAAQAGAVGYARLAETRYFCWAPYDRHTEYELVVRVGGRELGEEEIGRRYRRAARGFEARSPAHVMDVVERAEGRLPAGERAEVRMRYRVNGVEQPEWRLGAGGTGTR